MKDFQKSGDFKELAQFGAQPDQSEAAPVSGNFLCGNYERADAHARDKGCSPEIDQNGARSLVDASQGIFLKGLGGGVVKSSLHNDDEDLSFLTLGDLHAER